MPKASPNMSYGNTTTSRHINDFYATNINEKLKIDSTITHNEFEKLLPYESIDKDLIFLNKQSKGFGLHVIPTHCPDNSLISSVIKLIKHKLPIDIDCSVMLHKHPYISKKLHRGLQPMLNKGGIFTQLAEKTLNSHLNTLGVVDNSISELLSRAACPLEPDGLIITQPDCSDLEINESRLQAAGRRESNYQHPLKSTNTTLNDYQCYIFLSIRRQLDDKSILIECRNNLELLLNQGQLSYARFESSDFLVLMRSLISSNLGSAEWPAVLDVKQRPLNQIITQTNNLFETSNSSVKIISQNIDKNTTQTRIVSCELHSYPNYENHIAKNCEPLIENFHPELNLPCNFLLNVTLRGRNRAGIHPFFYNLMLFTTPENQDNHLDSVFKIYTDLNLQIQPAETTQWLSFLSSLPFFITEGYYHELNMCGRIKKLKSHDAIKLLPLIADKKGSRQGLLIPTNQQQITFLNTFDKNNYPIINFNYLMEITKDNSKNLFSYMHIINELALDECLYVLDFDGSYQDLCKIVGGNSILATKELFNPFELLKIQNAQDRETLRDLLLIMINPKNEMTEIQKLYLFNALEECYQTKKKLSCMNDLLGILNDLHIDDPKTANKPLLDLIQSLQKINYSGLFNNSLYFKNSINFTIFDLSQIREQDELIIIIVLIIIGLLKHMQQIDPTIKKRCIIDNTKLHLTSGDNPIVANLITKQFQLASQYNGGFGVIVNSIDDILKTQQGHAVMNASDMKIIINASHIKSYTSRFPHRLSHVQKGIIAAFEDNPNSRYYDVLIEAGRSLSLHRYWMC